MECAKIYHITGRSPSVTRRRRLLLERLEERCLLSALISEYGGLTPNSAPTDITLGPDGNLWFTEEFASKIGRINLATGRLTEFPTPTPNSEPNGITTGPDGNIWFTE